MCQKTLKIECGFPKKCMQKSEDLITGIVRFSNVHTVNGCRSLIFWKLFDNRKLHHLNTMQHVLKIELNLV